MSGMQIGDVLRIKTARHRPRNDPDAKVQVTWLDYAHPDRKKIGVYIFIGFEDVDSPVGIDANDALKAMGWTPPKEPRP